METQDDIRRRIDAAQPDRLTFVKDRPILGWRLDDGAPGSLPASIRDNLGEMDETGYQNSYLRKNIGSIIALQMTSDGPDFYVVGKSTFDRSYVEVPLREVAEKNRQLLERLEAFPDLLDRFRQRDSRLVAARKCAPVEMIAMSDIGYPVEDEVRIDSPWGAQTKPPGVDGFIVCGASDGQYYLINSDENGRPIGYVPASPSM